MQGSPQDQAHPDAQVQVIAVRLKDAGLKVTAQRLAVVRCLVGDVTHPTAQELFERLRPSFPTMSFATVYNTLSALSSVGAVKVVELGGPARFDPNVETHDHFVCSGCGLLRDVPAEPLSTSESARVEQASEVEVHRVERLYRGLCASCRNTRGEMHEGAQTKRE